MAATILLIQHGDNPRDDRAATHLEAQGFDLEWCRPFDGGTLPARAEGYAGTLLYGGPQPLDEIDRYPFLADEARWVERCMAAGTPVLGICLGAQVVAHALGAPVGPPEAGVSEFGYYPLQPTPEGAGLIPDGLVVVQSHFHGFGLPAGATLLAASELFPHQAFRHGERTYALQFHPEITRAGFRRWQDADWARWGEPGVQTRAQQDALGARHDPAQHRWFTAFLDGFYGGG